MPCRTMEMACNQCTDDVLNDGDDTRSLFVWYCVVLIVDTLLLMLNQSTVVFGWWNPSIVECGG